MRFLCKEKLEKLPGKLENSGKTESAFCDGYALLFFFVLFVIVVKKFSGKKNRDNYEYKGKSKNSGKLQKF
jgi:NhaP-type Na+/H+ or K+/H+ antiporter